MALEYESEERRGVSSVIDLLPWRRPKDQRSGLPIQRLELLETLFRCQEVRILRPGDPEAKLFTVWLKLQEELPEESKPRGRNPRKITLAVKAEPKELTFWCLLQGRVLGSQELRESLEVEQVELLEELATLQSEVARLREENRQLWATTESLSQVHRGLPRPFSHSEGSQTPRERGGGVPWNPEKPR